MKTKTDYDIQAEQFLTETGTEFTAKYLYNGPFFEGEKDSRDIYSITLKRGAKVYEFRFGQSIANSGLTVKRNPRGRSIYDNEQIPRRFARQKNAPSWMLASEKDRVYPTAYAVLACLTKDDPGTFEDFCANFGYDTDSRKAEKTYFAVQNEFSNLRRMFNEEELNKLREIQ